MNYPIITIEPHEWNAVADRVFKMVGTQIQVTRKIQYALRLIICALTVIISSVIYWFAMMSA